MIKIQGIDPDMIANNLTPAYPTHPGEVVKDEIEYRKISQRKLAEQTGIPYKMLNDILNGRRSMTTATAMMLEAALGVPTDSLMRLQLTSPLWNGLPKYGSTRHCCKQRYTPQVSRPAPLPAVEEGGTLVFQPVKDKAFFTEQRLRLGYAVQASLTDIAFGLRVP